MANLLNEPMVSQIISAHMHHPDLNMSEKIYSSADTNVVLYKMIYNS